MNLEHDELFLSLSGDWQQVPSDPEVWCFESASRHASIVLSVMSGLGLPSTKVEATARRLADVRADAEASARPAGSLHLQTPHVEVKEDGLAEMTYRGSDAQGLFFRCHAVVTTHKIVTVWVSTTTNELGVDAVLREVLGGLRVLLP